MLGQEQAEPTPSQNGAQGFSVGEGGSRISCSSTTREQGIVRGSGIQSARKQGFQVALTSYQQASHLAHLGWRAHRDCFNLAGAETILSDEMNCESWGILWNAEML